MANQDLDPDRVARVAARLADGERDPERRLCSATAAVVSVTGAGVVLISGGTSLGNVCVSDDMTARVEDLQYMLGEGPCVDAFRTRAPVLVPDLADAAVERWPTFREGAAAVGARAAFGFPVMVGSACIGALDLYQDRSGVLSDEQLADAVVVAHLVGRAVLGWQASAPKDGLAWQLEQVPAYRAAVHQATGMVSVQAGVSVADALLLVRAHAFAAARPISAIADDIVAGRLRLA
jgi:GAF domain